MALPGLDLLAQAYSVPLVDDWDHATALAREFGAQPVPEIVHAEAEAYALPDSAGQLRMGRGYFVLPAWIALIQKEWEGASKHAAFKIPDMRTSTDCRASCRAPHLGQ